MARTARTPRSNAGQNRQRPDFHKQLVLFQWAMSKLGVKDMVDFRRRYQLTPDSPGGLNEQTGRHRFFEAIINVLPTAQGSALATANQLVGYEQNIIEHTQKINTARLHHGQPVIEWKYHQYLSLLFTEMYLDFYFRDAEGLRTEINTQITTHNGAAHDVDKVDPFGLSEPAREQLARLAFWCATGSGKTLLMHMHIHQYRHYQQQAYQAGTASALDQVILITPNDGLSIQHAKEFTESGFMVVTAGEAGIDGLWADQVKKAIKILDIHKFRDEQGKATLATERFAGSNLVLVDEGHRGSSAGEEGAFLRRRDQIAAGGFCFEYSATLKEASQSSEVLRHRYARGILFDYAYRSFYRDGYGKDFTILNLEDDDKQQLYLTAALLLFYQQIKVWRDGGEQIKPFRIDKPLWVFVGHTVVGKVKNQDDQVSVSDVVEVLLFLRDFLADRSTAVQHIEELLANGFCDNAGRDLLAGKLPHVFDQGIAGIRAGEIYSDILREVFNAPGGGSLVVQMWKGAVGELALKIGEAEPFGVVNVGDPAAVADACQKQGITQAEDDLTRSSLFQRINRIDSSINLLVGSRKFTEGWNSWRVSSIGLMRMGRSEGTQIIQLFGRGVRLRGYGMSLRRSGAMGNVNLPPKPRNLKQVETLQVFGVKASYMKQFRDWIIEEVPEALEKASWPLPVLENLPQRKLKTLRLKDVIDGRSIEGGKAFYELGPLVILRAPHEQAVEDEWLRKHRARLNWLPKIDGLAGTDNVIGAAVGVVVAPPQAKFGPLHRALLDYDDLWFGLEAFKASHNLNRLHATRDSIRELFESEIWYELVASPQDMRTDRYENRVQWQRMAQQLLNNYAERFYRFMRGRWEAPFIEVVEINAANFNHQQYDYTIETTEHIRSQQDIDAIAEWVRELNRKVVRNKLELVSNNQLNCRTVPFLGHLYQPLLHVARNQMITIRPVALDKHEASFVTQLAKWAEVNRGQEIFLLRNQAVSGLGFFQAANFFPDFLMWVIEKDTQHLVFVDPKGLVHHQPGDPKVQFATSQIPELQRIVDRYDRKLRLHAFLLSNTPYADLPWRHSDGQKYSKAETEALGVLFEESSDCIDVLIQKALRRAG